MLLERTFNTGEITINYAEGPRSGPPLVLLHGLTGWWKDFRPLISHLANEWHIFAPDQRGHGKSGRGATASDYRAADYVRDILRFVREVVPGEQPFVLVAFSGGALTAMGVAAAVPERIRGIVLLDPVFMIRNSSLREYAISEHFAWVHAVTKSTLSFDEMLVRCQELMPDAEESLVRGMAEKLSALDPNTTDPTEVDRVLEGFDLEGALRRVTCPVLILHGERQLGSIVRQEDAEWAQENLALVNIVQISGAGHPVHLQQPEVTLQHILEFLRSV
jgi:pimeloyl-ACP methyl ester carboxylesterase